MKKRKTMTVWLDVYQPFIMGGSVHRIKKTVVPVIREFTIRRFKCACVEFPPNAFRVASVSAKGALVSNAHASADDACQAVENDILEGDPAVMRDQVKSAVAMFDNREHDLVAPEEFFK